MLAVEGHISAVLLSLLYCSRVDDQFYSFLMTAGFVNHLYSYRHHHFKGRRQLDRSDNHHKTSKQKPDA